MIKTERLSSLDILRGLDLFFLVFLQPVLMSLGSVLNLPLLNSILYQFDHEIWEGFRLWDIIMPLFLFMTGIALPFSLNKYKEVDNRTAVYVRIFRRVIILCILGMVVQGNLLGFDHHYFRFYSNTLQAIAIGYLIASVILLNFSLKNQLFMALGLMVVYWIPMTFLGDFTPQGNFAMKVDKAILGRFMDGVYWKEDGSWAFSEWYDYTWVWSSLTFGVTVLMGTFAGQIIRSGKDRIKNAKTLFCIGVVCILLGLLLGLQMPIIKRIWTCSMVLYSGGICFLLISFFYYIIDCKGYIRGFNWLKIYGLNSIAAYVLGEVINFRSIAQSLFYGFEQFMGDYYLVWITFINYLIVFLILRLMHKYNIFVKI